MLTSVTVIVCPGATSFALPTRFARTVTPSLAKMVIPSTADFDLLEIFVTRAFAPALPKSVLKLTDASRKDLSWRRVDLMADLVGATFGLAAVQMSEQVSLLPPLVITCPTFVHFEPALTAASLGTTEMTVRSNPTKRETLKIFRMT